MPWYYVENGESVGPVSDADFDAAVAARRVTDDTLVWQEGMSDWLAYSQVRPEAPAGLPVDAPESAACAECGQTFSSGEMIQYNDAWICANCKPVFLQRIQEGAPPPAAVGGRGETPNDEITANARKTLQGNWGLAIGLCLVYGALTISVSFILGIVAALIPIVGQIFGEVAQLLIAAPLQLGATIFFVRLTLDDRSDIGILFSGFNHYGAALGTAFFAKLIVAGWTLLAVLPGLAIAIIGGIQDNNILLGAGIVACVPAVFVAIVVSYMYVMAFYILAERPEIGCFAALKQSRFMMQGMKMKFFGLYLRFVGWSCLAVLTLFIGLIWVVPYMLTAMAGFYHDTKGRLADYV